MLFVTKTWMTLLTLGAMQVQGYSLCTTAPFPFEGKEDNLTSIPIVQTQETVNGSAYTVSGQIAITGRCSVSLFVEGLADVAFRKGGRTPHQLSHSLGSQLTSTPNDTLIV